MAEERVQRRLAAILAADMVGYSRLMEADEAGTIARQKAHRAELIDPKITEHHGRIVKTTGDGLLVEFSSVVDAVACAVEVQRAMVEREADVPEERRIEYRVGVNLGDIVIDADDILGGGVNVAARLYFRMFYAAANASAAHSALCERVFGRDLCQEGMVDMEALDDLLDRLDLKPGDTLLDLGCGAGGIAEYISDRTGARVTGIDISPSAIEVAQARTVAKRDRLDFVIGDLNALDLQPNTFDAAISLDALYWVSDIDRTLDDILASLRPGGQLAVHTLHGRDADEPLAAMEAQASPIAKALDRKRLSYEVSEHTANNAAFWQRNYKAAVDLRDTFSAEGNVWIADSLIRDAEEEFLPAFDAGLMARYLFHVRL